MNHIVRVIVYKLWIVSSATLISSVLVFWFYGGFLGFTTFALGVSGIFYNAQDLLLYYPNDPPDSRTYVLHPNNYRLPYESIKIPCKDGLIIHMFLIKQSGSCNVPTMIFFHGNAGNMGQRLANVSGFYNKLNINVLMVEYRGYGLSEGTPSERGLYLDAQAALDYLHQRTDIDPNKIIVFGRSLGGAVAIDLASRAEHQSKIWLLIVENTFTSIPDMAHIILKWRCLHWMPSFIHKNKYASLSKMSKILIPTLVICGSIDALVPPSMGKALYSRCAAVRKKLLILPGGGHDDTWTCREYYPSILQVLTSIPSKPNHPRSYYSDEKLSGPSTSTHNTVYTV